MASEGRPFLILSLLLFLFFTVPLLHKPHKISLKINGSSSLTVLADRATISLKVSSEGTKQAKVTDQVRQTSDEILQLLRPLTLPPDRTSLGSSATSPSSVVSTFLPPIATLSVNTFSSHSYPRAGLLGDTETYRSSITVTAEFRSLLPRQDTPGVDNNRTIVPGSGFHHLSLVLPALAKLPHTKVDYLKWFLSPDYLSSLQSSARQKAMADGLTKISDFIAPMNMRFPAIYCLNFQEQYARRAYEFYEQQPTWQGIRKQDEEAIMYAHDEVDGFVDDLEAQRYGYEIEERKMEAFGLEPQSMEISSQVEGEWVVTERGLTRALWGLLV